MWSILVTPESSDAHGNSNGTAGPTGEDHPLLVRLQRGYPLYHRGQVEDEQAGFCQSVASPVRSIISVLAVAIEVIMMLTIIAIMLGQLTGQKRLNNGIGADMIVRPPNTTFFNGVGGAPISVRPAAVLGGLPHVAVSRQ